jgi:SET domain-containing protein
MFMEGTVNIELVCKPSRIEGMGLFAAAPIPKETRVIEYVGEKIDSDEMLRRCAAGNFYIFALGEGQYIDGKSENNLARFINHSCEPNCEIRWEGEQVWIIASRDMRAGEEVTYNYSYDLEDYRHYPCHCGSSRCAGYIVAEEFFDHVRSQSQLRHANA